MRDATLCLLQRFNPDQEVLLAMKKRGFGVGKWNGVGGKVQENETIEEAAVREAEEEIGVKITEFEKVAEFTFLFPTKLEWPGQVVHVYLVSKWEGEPAESEEMAPKWFKLEEFPYSQMWADDEIWMPHVFAGKKVKGKFEFDGDTIIGEPQLEILEDL